MSLDYAALVSKLEGHFRRMSGKDHSLTDSHRLNAAFDHPDRHYPVIHVAGTNGKGSTVTKLAHLLQSNGYRTGMNTSPHLSSFRERIQINGELISEEEVVDLLTKGFALCQQHGIEPSFFELTSCAALRHFANKQVDVAVIETGLGGRLDATNIVHPVLSVITSISFDHTQFLGSTLDAIAKEKGGIIKPNVPIVLGPRADFGILRSIASTQQATVYAVKGQFATFDEENQAIVRQCAELIQERFPWQPSTLSSALQACPPCRFQYVPIGFGVILDVAHNSDGVTQLLRSLQSSYPDRTLRIVCGFSADKDISQMLAQLASASKHVHLVSANHPRALDVSLLQLDQPPFSNHPSVEEGVAKALSLAQDTGDLVVICGSFFLMRQVRDALGIAQVVDPQLFREPLQKM